MSHTEFGRREHPPPLRPEHPPPLETGPQPDPTPREGRVSKPWKWAITAAIAAVLLLAMYGITSHQNEQHAAGPPATSEPSTQAPAPTPPSASKPGG